MKKALLLLFLALSATTAIAQEENILTKTAYPPSNQLNPPPQEPDHTYGSSIDTHKLPAGLPSRGVGTTSVPMSGIGSKADGNHPASPSDGAENR